MSRRRIVLCGGGSGTHVLVADLGRRADWEVRVLTSRPDAWRGEVTCVERGGASDSYPLFLRSREQRYSGRATQAFGWDQTEEALDGADAVLLVCPVHAHRDLLARVLPALDPAREVIVGSLYAQGGFDWIARDIVESAKLSIDRTAIFGLKRYPYVCRQQEYARSVILYGRFPRVLAAIKAPNAAMREKTERLLRDVFSKPVGRLPSFVSCTLNMSNQILHPGLAWGHFHDFVSGSSYPTKRLLYGDANVIGAHAVEDLFADLIGLLRAIEGLTGLSLAPHLGADPLLRVFAQLRLRFGLDSLRWRPVKVAAAHVGAAVLRSNERLRHVPAPMVACDSQGGFVPDFGSRFWEDDIGHGLCVLYGLGQLVGQPMPHTENMIRQQQRFMSRDLLGADGFGDALEHTNAPQRYGISDAVALKSFLEW